MKALIAFVLLLLWDGILAQSIWTGTFKKFNPQQDGAGPVDGTIWYDAVYGGIKMTYQPNGATEWYRFSRPPLPTATNLFTTCTQAIATTPLVNQTYNSLYGFPFTTTNTPSSTCEPGSTTTCTVGTRISATAQSSSSISYVLTRSDSASSTSCGCPVGAVYINIPPCATGNPTVTGTNCVASYTATTKPDTCGGVQDPAGIANTLKITGCTSFTVTIPGTYVNPAPITVSGGSSACTSCPTAAFTCTPPGTGIIRYKKANTGCPCDVADIGDQVFWPLASTDISSLYIGGVPDANVKFGGNTCNVYKPAPGTVTNITQVWTRNSPYTVCQFSLNSGETYTMSTFTSQATSDLNWFSDRPTPCSYCSKPVDTIFISELSTKTYFSDVVAMQNFISTIANNFQIIPPSSNFGLITYKPGATGTTVVVDLPLSTGVTQDAVQTAVKGGMVCPNTPGTVDGPCCSSGSVSLVPAINAAATQLAGSTRAFSSRNIVLLTEGAFTDSSATIVTALRNAQKTVGRIINLYIVAMTRDNTVLQLLNTIKAGNDANSWPSVGQYETNLKKVVNRVYARGSASTLVSDLEPIVSGICGGNGDSSCGKCCGDCTCGTICVPPYQCKNATCFTVGLTPLPSTSSTCCNYQTLNCPVPADLCLSSICNYTNGLCTSTQKQCPANNQCYNYKCNPATGLCDEIPNFTVTDLCNVPSCNRTSNTIVYSKTTCVPRGCATVNCTPATGLCTYTDYPVVLPTPCHIVSGCSSNKWTYTLNCPAATDPCQVPTCVITGTNPPTGSCGFTQKCTIDACNTCVKGNCQNITCPAYYNGTGTLDKCKPLNSIPCALPGGCSYRTTTCTPLQCQTSTCNSATGNCDVVNLCPRNQAYNATHENPCRPLTGCNQLANGQWNCSYSPNICVPSNGYCGLVNVCPVNPPGNKCLKLISCDFGNCTYGPAKTCTATNACNMPTCTPSTGACTEVAWPGCPAILNNTYKCRQRATCVYASNTCTYSTTDLTCTPSDTCSTATCSNSTGCVSTSKCTTNYNNSGVMDKCYTYKSCSAGVCQYNFNSCTPGCTGTVCNPATGTCVAANYCPVNETIGGVVNKCRQRNVCYGVNNCTYLDKPCAGGVAYCADPVCDTNTGICSLSTPWCTANETIGGQINMCRPRLSCSGPNNCAYYDKPCATAPCRTPICDNKTGVCSLSAEWCPVNETIGGVVNLCRTRLTCNGPNNCVYTDKPCGGTGCAKTQCDPATGNCVPINFCAANETSPLGVVNYCRPRVNCYAVGNCSYTDKPCPGGAAYCADAACDTKTGICSLSAPWCTANETIGGQINMCRPRLSCSGPNNCAYYDKPCATAPCRTPICDNKTGVCSLSAEWCPANETIGGVVNMCRPRLTCTGPNNCVYSDKSCGGTNCAKTQCDPATGNCVPINFCPKNPLVGGVPDLCRTLQNCYAVGNCSYVPAVTCTPPTACQTSTCQPATGTCLVANITSWDPVASCPAVSCQNPVKDPSAKTCCGYVPKCPPSSDYCVNATCVNNECVTNPRTCPPSAPGTPCTVNTGCSGGTCTYTAKTCPPSVDPCQTNVCNYQGNCVLQANNNPGCIDYCVGKVCPDVNCTQYTCNSATGACVDSTFPSTSCVLPNSCFIPTCNTTTSQCNLEAITVETCIKNYGAAPICQYWGLTPFRDSCCQLLPLCNTQLDPEHLCSLLYCDNTTNGKCLLKDNSAALCKPFLNDDLCRPLRTCDNSTGACLYDNLATNCEAIKPLACQDASCDPATGQCIFVNTSACKPVSKCFNVTCQKDECVIYTCDESDGKCYLNATTVCTAPNTCTHASCDPLLGCQYTPVDVNIECGVLADPCKVWVKNFTDPRCCGTTVRCAPSGDLCAPTICNATGKSCVNLTFTDICPAFDNSSGKPNKCRPLTGCALGGCIYQDLTCDKISNCMIPTCDPDTGLCSYTDSCPTNPCVSKRCNLVSGLCEVSSSLDCYLDSCTNTTCNPVLGGCQTLKVLGLSDCPTPTNSCMVNTLNAKNPTCCGETPKCVNNDPCFNVACVNGTCVTSSVCNSSTCATVSCSVVNGRPVCSQKAIPCVPQNPCFTVNTCVEGKPFTCTQTPLDCVKSNNKCIKYSCDPTAKSAATACTATPIICDDKNPCTNNTCNTTTGLCSYPNACVSSNLCLIPSCNATKGCVFTKKVCNDYDSCTDDECDVKTGKCEFKKKNCDDKNPCTVDTCSANLGCVNSPLDCTNVTRKNATSIQCGFWACNKSGAGCYPVVKVCNTILLTNTVIGVVAGTSAGVIVGIVVAIVAALGCAGGTTYAAYQRVEFSEDAPIYRNPLYEDPTKAGNNALYKPASG